MYDPSTSDGDKLQEITHEMVSLKKSIHPGFVIPFDNIDIQLKRRNMTKSNQNQDHHWVNHQMVENRIGANFQDSKKPKKELIDAPNLRFLPS